MLRSRLQKPDSSRGKSLDANRRLRIESLEDRRVLSADPGWLATIGGSGTDTTYQAVADDLTGDVYIAGRFSGTVDFDPSTSVTALTALGPDDGYVAKYTSGGSLVWARRMGGIGDASGDYAGRAAIGADGFIYITGGYRGAGDFDGDGIAEQPNRGGSDLFVTKIASSSGTAIWTKTFGGDYDDTGGDFAIAADGSLFVTGVASDSSGTVDVDPGAGIAPINTLPFGAIFVLKLDASGNYVTSWANISTDWQARPRIAVDDSGVYLGGVYRGTVDFDSGPGQVIREPYLGGTQHDAFVARYSQQGDFGWVRTLRGTNTSNYEDWVNGIAIDGDRVYVGGNYYYGLDLNDDNVADLPGNSTRDVFVASYSKADGTLAWAKNIGTSTNDEAVQVLATDSTGALLAYGYFAGTVDFDPGPGVSNLSAATNPKTGFSLKLDASTGTYQGASRLEGYSVNFAKVDSNGMLYLAGSFADTAAFPNGNVVTSAGGSTSGWVPGNDGFILKFNTTGPRVSITSPTSSQTLLEGSTVSFTGTAVDDQGPTSSLVWRSQLTGTLGTGGSIGPLALGVGAHVVTAQATDNDGLVGSSSVSVLVNPKAPTNLTGTVSGSQVTLHWLDKSAGETAYQVEKAVKPSGKNGTPQWSVVAVLPANAIAYVDAPGSGNWLYRVQATAARVVSAYSNELSISIANGGKKTASVNVALTAEPQTNTTTDSGVSSPALLPANTADSTSHPTVPGLLFTPAKPSAKSKVADAALATDESWFDGALEDELLLELIAAR